MTVARTCLPATRAAARYWRPCARWETHTAAAILRSTFAHEVRHSAAIDADCSDTDPVEACRFEVPLRRAG